MTYPVAYDPEPGYQYQLLCRHPDYNGRQWEHCSYAIDRDDKRKQLYDYRLAYPPGYEFKAIMLPYKYWPKR